MKKSFFAIIAALVLVAEITKFSVAGLNITPGLPSVPSGTMVMYGGSAAPSGWVICDGTAISRTTYAGLFAVLSTTYGTGDGSTTFNVPDSRGVFVRGSGSQTISTIVYTGTRGTTQGDALQGHFHQQQHAASLGSGIVQTLGTGNGNGANTTGQTWSLGPSTDGSNGTPRTGSETRPANIVMLYIIKT